MVEEFIWYDTHDGCDGSSKQSAAALWTSISNGRVHSSFIVDMRHFLAVLEGFISFRKHQLFGTLKKKTQGKRFFAIGWCGP